MQWSIVSSLDEVPAAVWNRVSGTHDPFIRHEFLIALERHGCVGEGTGWIPRHLLLHDGARVVGAIPMYLKQHSFGEYVFDWAWADAYARYGMAYYPKLVAAVPFSPVTGERLLAGVDGSPRVKARLADAALSYAREQGVSSMHWLFTSAPDSRALAMPEVNARSGCQFHWLNPGLRDFDDFLDTLRSKKRKQIKRERRQALQDGVEVEILSGPCIDTAAWSAFYHFYCATYDRKWGMPYLSLGFFREIGVTLGKAVLLVMARKCNRYVAGALCLRGADTLYGRNWGSVEYHPALHYELCYYRTIEYCIDHGLRRFEAGAQGEYKVSRGLQPVQTRSAHWMRDAGFRRAIAVFLDRERRGVKNYMDEAERHSPFKTGCTSDSQVAPRCVGAEPGLP